MKTEQLVPYLPYKVNVLVEDVICEVEGIDLHWENTLIAERVSYKFEDVKLVLRPLSDLTKEIEVDGEKFIPIEKLRSLYCETTEYTNGGVLVETLIFKDNNFQIFQQDLCYIGDYNREYYNPIGYSTSVELYTKLFEWHFDVFGLIEKGEAVDINSL